MEKKFKITKTEYVNRTFRLPRDLVETVSIAASDAGVSVNEFMIQAARFALNNLDTDNKKSK